MEAMVTCLDALRETSGVESICARAHRDDVLKVDIDRVWHEQESVHGAKRVWRQLGREKIAAARCTVERLMKSLGLTGVVRSGRSVVTTRPDLAGDVPDLVERRFTATRPRPAWCITVIAASSIYYLSMRYTERLAEAGVAPDNPGPIHA